MARRTCKRFPPVPNVARDPVYSLQLRMGGTPAGWGKVGGAITRIEVNALSKDEADDICAVWTKSKRLDMQAFELRLKGVQERYEQAVRDTQPRKPNSRAKAEAPKRETQSEMLRALGASTWYRHFDDEVRRLNASGAPRSAVDRSAALYAYKMTGQRSP